MFAEWNRKHVLFIVLALLLGGTIISIGTLKLLTPLDESTEYLESRRAGLESQIEKANSSAKWSYENERAVLEQTSRQIPVAKNSGLVLEALQRTSEQTNVHIESVSSRDVAAPDGSNTPTREMSYQLKVSSGQIVNIERFLSAIQGNERYMRVNTLSVEQGDKAFLNVTISVFYGS